MRAVLLLMLATSFLCQLNPSEEGKKYTQALSLSSFENMVDKGNKQRWFIMAYTPKCRQCKELRPLFHKMAFDKREGNVKFGEIDCSNDRALCKLLRIKSYPTLFMVNNNKIFKFTNSRTEDNIHRFIRDDWDQVKAYKVPEKMPSFWEEIYTGIFDMGGEIADVYKSKNLLLKAFISIFLVVLLSLIGAVIYFLYTAVFAATHTKTGSKKAKRA